MMRARSLLTVFVTGFGCCLLSVTAHAELPERIRNVLNALDISHDDVSILIEETGTRTPLLSHLPERSRNPASVMKLVTTYSALELLGPAYVWPTDVFMLGSFDGEILDVGSLLLLDPGFPGHPPIPVLDLRIGFDLTAAELGSGFSLDFIVAATAVPEPTTLVLVALGIAVLSLRRSGTGR